MKAQIRFILLLLTTALIASSAFFFFPDVSAAGVAPAVAIAFSSSITQILAVWYFLIGLRTFKRGLKVAYYWLAAGIFFFSLSQIVPSLSVFTDILSSNSTVASIGLIAPYALSSLFIYMAMHKFTRLLDVRTPFGNVFVGLAVASVVTGLFWVMLAYTQQLDWIFILIFASAVWCGVLGLVAAWVALRVERAIGPLYKRLMLWVSIAIGSLALTALHEVIVKVYFPDSDYVLNQYSLLPFLLTGVLFLWAGLTVKQAAVDTLQLPPDATYIDVVVGIAGLVSKPDEIDEVLDNVRMVTSKVGQNKDLSAEDTKNLVAAYVAIEDYLLTREPLHTFSKEGLRGNLPDGFVQALNA